ncbi:MAG: hypothetical protein JJT85_13265 [Chromatiales bacterium]|nr:hypothetical protein [Chromatiales bacterium]
MIQPDRYHGTLEQHSAGQFTLTIDEPGIRVLAVITEKGEVSDPVYIMAEPSPLRKMNGDREVLDVSHLASLDPALPITADLQKVLDRAAESPRGALIYFGPGDYHIGSVEVGSNTELHLALGARLVGKSTLDSYDPDNMVLLLFRDARNSGLSGYGSIIGNGDIIQSLKPERTSIYLVRFSNSRNVFVHDVLLRNAVSWTLHLSGSENVRIERVRIIGDRGLPNVDGINPDHSRNVVIRDAFVSTSDDAIAVKTTRRLGGTGDTNGILVTNSLLMTPKTAMKIGTESFDRIHHVLVEDVDIVFSGRGLGAFMLDGGSISDLTFRNIRMSLYEQSGESLSGEPFRFVIGNRKDRGEGTIRRLLFESISIVAPYQAVFLGTEQSMLSDITLHRIHWRVTPSRHKAPPRPLSRLRIHNLMGRSVEGRPLIQAHWVDQMNVRGLTIDWTESEGQWDRMFDIQKAGSKLLEDVTSIGIH